MPFLSLIVKNEHNQPKSMGFLPETEQTQAPGVTAVWSDELVAVSGKSHIMYWCPSLKYSTNISPHNPSFKGTQRQSCLKIACAVPCPGACIKPLADATWGQALQSCYCAPIPPLAWWPCPVLLVLGRSASLSWKPPYWEKLGKKPKLGIVPILCHMISSIPDKMSLAISHQQK